MKITCYNTSVNSIYGIKTDHDQYGPVVNYFVDFVH